ncbi:RagB/SusD family nutrient uptake outer membrane protein [Reichenbachiella ulvae]|uniref:RagB/SusD family nutrient uptake outer membrane protein n=1 Tax=Reichenbachiella ulvae TaxID=2980104 RepID=A0ABT3CW08_9BACT|nr:RagB/SusD family nutrient uptake outer membrane protein [Reichenbachiella ulvae]MCV9387897.1 RagB/SusD family nutrient uptake outer membrane protein [Reichenbachiella ulvae]
MKRLYITLLTTVFAIGLWSCEDDFLNKKSTDLSDDLIWSDPDLAETYLMNLYTSVRLANKEPNKWEGSAGLTRGHHWALFSSISDESIYSNDDQTYLIQTGQLSPSNYGFTSTSWGRNYLGIRECNDALQKIPTLEIDDSKMNELLAEVRFIRAVRYFELLRGFGGVPLIGDRVVQLDDSFDGLYERSTIDETVDYIINELEFAINNLPEQGVQQMGRATAEAAMGFKARTLLYAASPLFGTESSAKWQAAADAAGEIIALGKFDLVDDLDADPAENYRLLFLQGETSEDIFMRHYTQTSRSFPMEKMNAPNGYGGWGGNCPMQNLVDDYEMDNGLAIDEAGSGYDDQNPYVNRDPRFYATVLYNGVEYRGRELETFLPGGLDSPDGNEPWNTSPTGYYLRKFMDETSDLNNYDITGGVTPWRYMRYAEILLSYAEAQNEATGPNTAGIGGLTATEAVNLVRERAGLPLLSGLSQAQLRDKIRNERRVELAFEEHRYYDVRRWMIAMDVENEAAAKVAITRAEDGTLSFDYSQEALTGKSFSEQHYWFPIPIDEITKSNSQLEQNPNYN